MKDLGLGIVQKSTKENTPLFEHGPIKVVPLKGPLGAIYYVKFSYSDLKKEENGKQ